MIEMNVEEEMRMLEDEIAMEARNSIPNVNRKELEVKEKQKGMQKGKQMEDLL